MRTDFKISSGATAALDTGPPRDVADNPPSAIPTVLFVPGYTGSKEDFRLLLNPLHNQGFRCVAIDQRGQYESDWAEDAQAYTIAALAVDLCEIGQSLRSSASELHLVGHSLGGLVARAATLAEPGLFDTLTLMASGPADIQGTRRVELDATEPILSAHGIQAVWKLMDERAQSNPAYLTTPPEFLEFLRVRFLANDPIGLKTMGDQIRAVDDRTEELAASPIPKLVLHGVADDAWTPAIQKDMAERLTAEYSVIENAAHSPAVENPDATLAVLLKFWLDATAGQR
jgi:pimeloyl-ACP methyl ester carboxylesterase